MAMYVVQALDIRKCMVGWAHLSKSPGDVFKKAISQMKTSKALGPTDIALEIIRAAGDTGTSMICDLAAAIICDGKVLS